MLNKQVVYKNGTLVGRGIEWTDYTLNAVGGCEHECRWVMPDGTEAMCYAKLVAERVAKDAYPHGFRHHYWHPDRLRAIYRLNVPSKIFVDSMSDLFGTWVPHAHIDAVLKAGLANPRHAIQVLTKNAPRMTQFALPHNVWAGVSSPPDLFFGKRLTRSQQEAMLRVALKALSSLTVPVRWMSFEPLSWDVSEIVATYPRALTWAVIGAATNGNAVHLPQTDHVIKLLAVLDEQRVPVFFKGNIKGCPATHPWREFFPSYVPSPWNEAPTESVPYEPMQSKFALV